MGKPVTQYCGKCKTRRPIKGFDIELGVCASCRGAVSVRKGGSPVETRATPNPPVPMKWRCPKCLQKVPVDAAGAVLIEHLNIRREICGASGYELPQKSQDAFDYRVQGSFESGKH